MMQNVSVNKKSNFITSSFFVKIVSSQYLNPSIKESAKKMNNDVAGGTIKES